MALSAATVFEVRNVTDFAGASDNNGGGFVTGASGTDYSFASLPSGGGPQATGTNLTVDGTTNTKVNPDGYTVAAGDVGNLIKITTTGTGAAFTVGWYQITVATTGSGSTQRWTLDRSPAAVSSAGASWNLGGCLATPGQAAATATVSGMNIWWKYSSTDFTATTSTAGSGGPMNVATNAMNLKIEGYDQTRGDRTGNRPRFNWGSVTLGSVTYAIIGLGNGRQTFVNIAINCNSVTNASGISLLSADHTASQCIVSNAIAASCIGFSNNQGLCFQCGANSCTTGFTSTGSTNTVFAKCTASSCGTGFTGAAYAFKCLASACTNFGFTSTKSGIYSQCTADGCTASSSIGIDVSANSFVTLDSCISSNNNQTGAIGFKLAAGNTILINCASYNNTTEITNNTPQSNVGMILNASFTGQPYTTPGSDFRPNATPGAGLLLRNAGIGVYGQTDNVDIGAVQSSTSSPSFLVHPGMQGGARG